MQTLLRPKEIFAELPVNWKKDDQWYSGDNLIDAYLKGKQDGRNETNNILSKQFETNLTIATSIAEKLFSEAKKKKIELKEIHLKANSITNFSALFVADENDFIADDFRNIFSIARKFKNKVESDSFYINFFFLPLSDSFNEKNLNAEGYFLKYEKK